MHGTGWSPAPSTDGHACCGAPSTTPLQARLMTECRRLEQSMPTVPEVEDEEQQVVMTQLQSIHADILDSQRVLLLAQDALDIAEKVGEAHTPCRVPPPRPAAHRPLRASCLSCVEHASTPLLKVSTPALPCLRRP